jgi:hypothetical protein
MKEETLLTRNGKPGFKPRPGTPPTTVKWVKKFKMDIGLWRESDFIPKRARTPQPPVVQTDILLAVFTVNRSAKRYRDAASTCYNAGVFDFAGVNSVNKNMLYRLKDRGILWAIANGKLQAQKHTPPLTMYLGEGYCFHTLYYPKDMPAEITDEPLFVESKPKSKREYKLKDAIATLESLPLIEPGPLGLERDFFAPRQRSSESEWDERVEEDGYANNPDF